MMTFEEYNHEHFPRKISKIEIIIGIVLSVIFGIYGIYNGIVGLK